MMSDTVSLPHRVKYCTAITRYIRLLAVQTISWTDDVQRIFHLPVAEAENFAVLSHSPEGASVRLCAVTRLDSTHEQRMSETVGFAAETNSKCFQSSVFALIR